MSHWPATASALEAALAAEHAAAHVEVHTASLDVSAARLVARLGELVAAIDGRPGPIVVTTATAGRRAPDHEVGADLLEVVLLALVRGAGGRPVVLADGPAFGDPYGAEVRRLGWAASVPVEVSVEDLNLSPERPVAGIPISKTLLDAAAVVSLVKAKTHRRFGVSLSEKAQLGAVVGRVTGHPKLASRHHLVPLLLEALSGAGPPTLSIIDGRGAVEGDGPLRGRPTDSHFLVIGDGRAGPDVQATIEMGFDPVLVTGFVRPRAAGADPGLALPAMVSTTRPCVPARSTPWLYRSHRARGNTARRDERYSAIYEGVIGALTTGPRPDQDPVYRL